MMPGTVLLGRYAEMSGYTRKALENKIERGVLCEGIHYYRAPDGRIHIDLENIDKWVKGQPTPASRPTATS